MAFRAKDYPDNWKELRAACLARDKNRCVKCHVRNGATGAWDRNGKWHYEGVIAFLPFKKAMDQFRGKYPKMVTVVLTCHHICREKKCDDLTHLEALCQRCHLQEEKPTAIEGRNRKRVERLAASAIALEGDNAYDEHTGRDQARLA